MKKLLSLLGVFVVLLVPFESAGARGGARVGGASGRSGGSRMGNTGRRSNGKKDQKEERERRQRENKAGLLRDARGDTE